MAIGLSCTHMLADLTFLASFFNSWTQVHRHVPITHPTRVAPLSNHALPRSLPPPHAHAHAESPSPTNATLPTATFKFPGSAIKQRLSDLRHTCPNATPFDLLAAVFWTRIKSDGHITLCTDFRAKESLPLGYLGNAMRFSRLSRKVEGEEVGHVVSAVHAHLEEESEGGSDYEYGAQLTCVCMEHLLTRDREGDQTSSLLYAPSFCADEKPLHVSCRVGNVGTGGLILVMPSREGGFSRTVTVTLPEEDQLAKLIKDQVILELEPAMLLSGSLQGQS